MVSLVRIEDAGETSQHELERLAKDRRCVRVGATQNPKNRIQDYRGKDKGLFIRAGVTYAAMYFAYYRGHYEGYMKSMEQRLLDIARYYGTGRLNEQQTSNYAYKWTQGYLYVILVQRDIEQGHGLEEGLQGTTAPTYPPPVPDRCFLTTRQALIAIALLVILCTAGFFILWLIL